MTYRVFLCTVLLPLLLLVVALLVMRHRALPADLRAGGRRGLVTVGILAVVAVVWTTPWDRWLILHGAWSYPPGSVIGTVARVPVEEYLFMVGQTLLTGCWTLYVTARAPERTPAKEAWRRPACCAGWLAAACAGWLLTTNQPSLYLGAILVWFAPPLALQAAIGADVLHAARADRLRGLALTPVLWAADALAIHAGAWRISDVHTVGFAPAGLPLEEAVFFLATNLLVVDSVLLVRAAPVRERMGTAVGRARRPAAVFEPGRH
ncbi:lycopene cyclase domain-containing protein [Streptomyces sp. NPDC057271]|uniref:lycopene cyclase domain-containing protein n=1 Tax=unclassified Streptomyces TaxID=2593676 RepID=UPI00362B5CB4